MATPQDQDPYRSPRTRVPTSARTDITAKPTALEWAGLIVLGIVVAIPTFFTTCLGSGLAFLSMFPASIYGTRAEGLLPILTLVCFGIAIWAGFVVSRTVYRLRRRRLSAEDNK